MKKIYILGSGGLAQEVYGWNLCQKKNNRLKIDGFISNDSLESLFGLPILSKSSVKSLKDDFKFIPCIGDINNRRNEFESLEKIGGSPYSFISDDVKIGANVEVGDGCILNPRSSISSNVTIKQGTIINCNSGIGHDTSIGSFCTLFGSVTINGNVKIGSNVMIGSGAIIHPGKNIDDGSIIGIGSVVLRNIKENTTVYGNPAKKMHI